MLGILRPLVRRLRPAARSSGACLGVVLALAGTAHADEIEERTQDAIDALREGNVSAALQVLGDRGMAGALAQRPALVHVLCDRAYRLDDVCRGAPDADRIQLSGDLLRIAESTHDAAPEDVRGLWHPVRERVLRD